MHHKRKRPKNRRAGCLMCKPWKQNNYGTVGSMRLSTQRQYMTYTDLTVLRGRQETYGR